LIAAADRGVFVHALIAFTNRGGEGKLRALESRFLAKGITVARTADDLVRYHGKMMIIDRRELYLFAFNFSHVDIDRSRSFGVAITNARVVQEAAKLFAADAKRQRYTATIDNFVISPQNSRKALGALIKSAKKQLL